MDHPRVAPLTSKWSWRGRVAGAARCRAIGFFSWASAAAAAERPRNSFASRQMAVRTTPCQSPVVPEVAVDYPFITLTAGWSDNDLLELTTEALWAPWTGRERAYAGHHELDEFIVALTDFAAGQRTTAELVSGPVEVGQLELRFSEYGLARHVAVELVMGRLESPHNAIAIKGGVWFTAPTERGLIASFARDLGRLASSRSGLATLRLLPQW